MKKPIRILTSDLLIADIVTPLNGNDRLAKLVDELGLKPGGKSAVSKKQLQQLADATQGHIADEFPGGSSANMVVTLSALLGDEVSIDFIGHAGSGHYGEMIASAMQAARIHMIEPDVSKAEQETAITYVIKYADGERTTATYPGNVHKLLRAKMITEAMVVGVDALFLQGSLWEKFEAGFANRLLEYGVKFNKEIWLALPTRAGFGVKKRDMFRDIIPRAQLVLANIAELSRISGIIDEHVSEKDITPAQKQQALEKLQQVFHEGQLAFITDGRHGAWVLTKHELIHADTINKTQIENTVGAGDTAYAGFLYGYLKGLPHATSAKIAMALAGEKLKCNRARLPDAQTTLQEILKNFP